MIRVYVETDKEALESFKAVAWPAADLDHWGQNPPNFSRHQRVLLAEAEGQVVGCGTISTDAGVALIEDVLVHPQHQGKGIGTELVQALEKEAQSLGCHKMWLVTGTDWSARFLYEKLGYSVRATLPNHYGNKDFLYFDKSL